MKAHRSVPVAVVFVASLSGCAAPPKAALVEAAGTGAVADPALLAENARIVLLGEEHDKASDHRWQFATLRRLYAQDAHMVLGFEMFPRAAQPALNAWVAGQLSEAAFLKQTDWAHVWGFDAALYMPIFRFARDHGIAMVALNVSHRLVHLVAQRGWAALPVSAREGIATPAPASAAYGASLLAAMGEHGTTMPADRRAHFIDAQLLWDRAMAEGVADAAAGGARVVALMGKGHVMQLQGVPYQLHAMGVLRVVALLPPGR